MQFLLLFTTLLSITGYNLASGNISQLSIRYDLESDNVTCSHVATCANGRTTDSLAEYACQCTAICARLNTCCFDSPYRSVKPSEIGSRCRPMNSYYERYFMVDRCPANSVWESLCKEEWNWDSDVLKLVPVTSLSTLMTYKNYFCFRCHETTGNYRYWNVELSSYKNEFDPSIDSSAVPVTYVPRNRSWEAPVGVGGAKIQVALNVRIPREISTLPVPCKLNVISQCAATWKDKNVIDKCEAYMGMVVVMQNFTALTYRNAHCAKCNYEGLSRMRCKTKDPYVHAFAYGGKVPFSFTHLLDVNRSDGDRVGKIQKCVGDSLFDPFTKRCRELKCALPGYVVKAGKCTSS